MQIRHPKVGMMILCCLYRKILNSQPNYSGIASLFAKLHDATLFLETKFYACSMCLCSTMVLENEHNVCFMMCHAMKHVFTFNFHSIDQCYLEKLFCYQYISTLDE